MYPRTPLSSSSSAYLTTPSAQPSPADSAQQPPFNRILHSFQCMALRRATICGGKSGNPASINNNSPCVQAKQCNISCWLSLVAVQVRTRLQGYGNHANAEQPLAQQREAPHARIHAQVVAELSQLALGVGLPLRVRRLDLYGATLAIARSLIGKDSQCPEHTTGV